MVILFVFCFCWWQYECDGPNILWLFLFRLSDTMNIRLTYITSVEVLKNPVCPFCPHFFTSQYSLQALWFPSTASMETLRGRVSSELLCSLHLQTFLQCLFPSRTANWGFAEELPTESEGRRGTQGSYKLVRMCLQLIKPCRIRGKRSGSRKSSGLLCLC